MSLFKFNYLPKTKIFPKSPAIRAGWVVKDWFFDRDRVKNMLDDETRFALQRFGQEVMYQAKKSMPWRQTPSKAGNPPHAHKGKNGYLPPRGNIKRGPFSVHYSFDPINRGVIIGPEKFDDKTGELMVPKKLEYGSTGSGERRKNPRRKFRRVGDSGIIRLADKLPDKPVKPERPHLHPLLKEIPRYKQKKSKLAQGLRKHYQKQMAHYQERMVKWRKDMDRWKINKPKWKKVRGLGGQQYYAVFAKLKTQKMAHRSMRLEAQVWGPFKLKDEAMAPRPYMHPAYYRKLQFLPRYYQDARIKASRLSKYR